MKSVSQISPVTDLEATLSKLGTYFVLRYNIKVSHGKFNVPEAGHKILVATYVYFITLTSFNSQTSILKCMGFIHIKNELVSGACTQTNQ